MKYAKVIPLIALMFVVSSCYHAKITTDKQPSSQVVENKWASSFVNGLVPPPEMDVGSDCANGVAKVETKLSFLNQIVAGITGRLYTPMTISVTCAAGGGMSSAADVKADKKLTTNSK